MTTYAIIDVICDSINPILFFLAVGLLINDWLKKRFVQAKAICCFLFGGLLLVYSIFFLDRKVTLWASFDADYSTHTAFAIAVCMAITMSTQWVKGLIFVVVLYMTAMLYQQYHSVFDIISTSIVIGFPLLLIKQWYANVFLRNK